MIIYCNGRNHSSEKGIIFQNICPFLNVILIIIIKEHIHDLPWKPPFYSALPYFQSLPTPKGNPCLDI